MQQMLKCLADESEEWDNILPYVVMAYNSTQQESTGLSPRLLVFGEEMPVPLDVMVGNPKGLKPNCEVEYIEWLRQSLRCAYDYAKKKLQTAATRQKLHYNKGCKPHKYRAGDFVWRWYVPAANRKLGRGWQGPFRIVACPTDVNCQIQREPGQEALMVHIDHLKPHLGNVPRVWQNTVDSENAETPMSSHDCHGVEPDTSTGERDVGEMCDVDDSGADTEPAVRRSRRTRKPPNRLDL